MHLISLTNLRHLTLFLLLALLGSGCIGRLPSTVKVQRDIEYAQVDGHSLKLDIYSPKVITNKVPVLVWLHPGAWDMGSKNFCPIGFMAEKYVAIVSVDYRLSQTAPFPAQLDDCKGAIRWLRAHASEYQLDPDRIGVFGASAGGHLALLLATTAKDPKMEGDVGGNLKFSSGVVCCCAFYPPTELNQLVNTPKARRDPNGDVARLIGGPVGSNVDKALAASPMTYLDKNCAPIFLLHDGADTLVSPQQSVMFYAAARKLGIDAQLIIVPNKGHGILAPPPAADAAYRFFDKYLKGP